MTRTYWIATFGCQMNVYDSECLAGVLESRGCLPAAGEDEADIIFLNTCVVRGSAEQRARGRIGRLKAWRQAKAGRLLGVCGCMAQRDGERLLKDFPQLDLVLGTRALPWLPEMLDRTEGGERSACLEGAEQPWDTGALPVRSAPLRALVTIMTGCNNFCSYCIVPYVRGRESSRPVSAILEEIEALTAQGCREVTLVGQNVNSYRDGEVDFAGLLEKVNALPDLWRIRYITSHPRDANARHLDAVRALDKVCDHFHLPAQSGNTQVLGRMNRGYSREDYLALIEGVRSRLPQATLTTDLIVGFPGEDEAAFADTLRLVEEVRYDSAFTFYYNTRSGTKAAEWPDDVPLEVKKERLARLIALQEGISLEKNREMEGREVEVLVEGPARRSGEKGRGNLMGRTTGDKCVIFDGEAGDVGRLRTVRIVEGASHTLIGEKVE